MRGRKGPEFRRGWRGAWEILGERIDVVARHTVRRRMARGAALVQAVARKDAAGLMVEETEYKWDVLLGRIRLGVVRLGPAGSLICVPDPPAPRPADTLEEAVRRVAASALARMRPRIDGGDPAPTALRPSV